MPLSDFFHNIPPDIEKAAKAGNFKVFSEWMESVGCTDPKIVERVMGVMAPVIIFSDEVDDYDDHCHWVIP